MAQSISSTTIGFPRIGKNREAKKALESYWKGDNSLESLQKTFSDLQVEAWQLQKSAGIQLIGLDGTMYDQILDWVHTMGIIPPRFAGLEGVQRYFAMARGFEDKLAMDMSKFFDTNYHYLVPELDELSEPKPNFDWFLAKVEAGIKTVGEAAVPILVGPNTLIGLGKGKADKAALVKKLVPHYKTLLEKLKGLGVKEVQLHEPILVTPGANKYQASVTESVTELTKVGLPINLVTYYDDIGETYSWVVKLPVQAVTLDFAGVPGSAVPCATLDLIQKHGFPSDKRLNAGIIDGRSVWADTGVASAIVGNLVNAGVKSLGITSSTTLQHLPIDKSLEKKLPEHITGRLAFAVQKLDEIVQTAQMAAKLSPGDAKLPTVGNPVANLDKGLFSRPSTFKERRSSQIKTRAFPTTTIGSFPQTTEIRRARLAHKNGKLSDSEYEKQVNEYMQFAIKEQEKLDIDVLVHGEPERSDMVEYFGQKLDGFCFTEHGWVQSYGSRYVRPPVIYGDVKRQSAMTVKEFKYAQDLTKRPVKGMLTGPVTILNWSFPRKDITRQAQAFQIALALREEVADLEKAGCRVIQVDEPALREGLPLKTDRWQPYLAWAVEAFRLSTAVAQNHTQIVTHLCYSDFADILEAIDGLDADVLTIENSRSGNEMVTALAEYKYSRDIGPGVYDVHSPIVPTAKFMGDKIKSFMDTGILAGNAEYIWVNPDCGLKTREWKQVLPSLENMVSAASNMRQSLKA
ncbi:hypothetical protein WJX84_008883 [Apatococcus fuscideae]|uniref:5-methyltetrahydropteroyltriglutamate--homocysteine S-methyltransferase n=1 Tax=Apatococcus fuscideae TaxID=2026836 RepID=A0AAW1SK35_9CHLO